MSRPRSSIADRSIRSLLAWFGAKDRKSEVKGHSIHKVLIFTPQEDAKDEWSSKNLAISKKKIERNKMIKSNM